MLQNRRGRGGKELPNKKKGGGGDFNHAEGGGTKVLRYGTGNFNMGHLSFSHSGGGHLPFSPLEAVHDKFNPVSRERTKSFGPAIFPFCSPPSM